MNAESGIKLDLQNRKLSQNKTFCNSQLPWMKWAGKRRERRLRDPSHRWLTCSSVWLSPCACLNSKHTPHTWPALPECWRIKMSAEEGEGERMNRRSGGKQLDQVTKGETAGKERRYLDTNPYSVKAYHEPSTMPGSRDCQTTILGILDSLGSLSVEWWSSWVKGQGCDRGRY